MAESTQDFLTTRELADLLRLKERKIYELAASGEVPCSRATGKLLFPRKEINAWLAKHGSGFGFQTTPRPDVFLGSHDPLLEWALSESGCALATYFDGSEDGLTRFAEREGVGAALHLYDGERDEWNRPQVAQRFAAEPVVLLEFAWRERGLIVAPGNPLKVSGAESLGRCRVVARQPGAGAQVLLTHLLAKAEIQANFVLRARSESDAALAVADAKADAAFGLRSMAERFRLEFIPMLSERVDLLIDRHSWFEPPLQRLAVFCRSALFIDKASELGGYDTSGFARVVLNGSC